MRRVLAALLSSALAVSAGLATCGGWEATAVDRRDCCARHHCEHAADGAGAAYAQSAADACCAHSQRPPARHDGVTAPTIHVAFVPLPQLEQPSIALDDARTQSVAATTWPPGLAPARLTLSVLQI